MSTSKKNIATFIDTLLFLLLMVYPAYKAFHIDDMELLPGIGFSILIGLVYGIYVVHLKYGLKSAWQARKERVAASKNN